MLVETFSDYRGEFRRKGKRKTENALFLAPVTVEIEEIDGAKYPVCVWSSPQGDRFGPANVGSHGSLKFGLRKLGQDFLRPVMRTRSDKDPKSVDPALVRVWKGRSLREVKSEMAPVQAVDFSNRVMGVGKRWESFGPVSARSSRWHGPSEVILPEEDVTIVEMRSSDRQARQNELTRDLSDRFVFVDGVLHERVPPLFFVPDGDRHSGRGVTIRGSVESAEALGLVAQAHLHWSEEARKGTKKLYENHYAKADALLEAACVVVSDEAFDVDVAEEIGSAFAASILSFPEKNPRIFAESRDDFLRAWVDFRDAIERGEVVSDALAQYSAAGGVPPTERREWNSKTLAEEYSSLAAVDQFLTRFSVPRPEIQAPFVQFMEFRP